MIHRAARIILIVTAFWLSVACRNSEPVDITEEKDLVNFTLPASVSDAAPMMQDHLYRVVAYNSARYKVKPLWVFIDGNRPVVGSMDPMVTRLNMVHLAYWEGERLLWSGSLLHPVGGGAHVFSSRGYEWSLRHMEGVMRLRFRDEGHDFEHEWPSDTDHRQWLSGEQRRLYMNQYVFPSSLVTPDAPPGEGPVRFEPGNVRPLPKNLRIKQPAKAEPGQKPQDHKNQNDEEKE
ncbi:MAG: hypothetical protein QNK37_13875 [Acidobacteriota bacterium]|nr:hypothetical protein [Acidobacteriota bacterium]